MQLGTFAFVLNMFFSAPSNSRSDSGASHHMSGMSSLFSTYHVCSEKDKFCRANPNSLLPVTEISSLVLLFIFLSRS